MIIVANWKAYVESEEKARVLLALAKRLSKQPRTRIVLAPPSPYLGLLAQGNKTKLEFAAQDISDTSGGAETGEVTAQALAGLGIKYVLLGHSERRERGETLEAIALKMQHAVAHGLSPILCIGEKERDEGAAYLLLLRQQLASALEPLTQSERLKVVIAYEPIWAIGGTATDTPQDVQEMVLYIRKILSDFLPGTASVPVLYGGSVEAENIRALAGGSGLDGFLVGHASVDPKMFSALVKALV